MGARRGTDKHSALINHPRGLAGDTDFRDFSHDRAGMEEWLAYLAEARAGAGTLRL